MKETRRSLSEFAWAPGRAAAGTRELREPADAHGEAVAEVSADDATGLWSWYVFLPDKYHINGHPCGLVRSRAAAEAVCEAILLNTILRR